jgi:hypothetical protein
MTFNRTARAVAQASAANIVPVLQAGLLAIMIGVGCTAWAQSNQENPDWTESAVPPPPAFDLNKLVTFDGAISSSLVYGVDPSTIQISISDSVVRYVLVATSTTGARNVMYEAIRCSTGEFKTYARYSFDGRWSNVSDAQWRSLFAPMPSKHALYFARAGVCDGAAPVLSAAAVVRRLKNQDQKNGNY